MKRNAAFSKRRILSAVMCASLALMPLFAQDTTDDAAAEETAVEDSGTAATDTSAADADSVDSAAADTTSAVAADASATGTSATDAGLSSPASDSESKKNGNNDKTADKKAEKSVITIISAQKSEYKKDPVNGGDSIVLTGNVKISVERGSDKTTISADSVNYNRATDMLYADGNVSFEQTGSASGGETVTANSLIFNTTTLEGVFDNGRIVQTQSDALNLPSGSTLVVASSVFGRDSSSTIAFKTGELTFCDNEQPHWRIKASRIWLLPGGEFAFVNALLFVGHVPLVYLPAFYYPKDELIFNPAFGYRSREGYFVNTTTYLYGRKPLTAATSSDASSASSSSSSSSDSSDDINIFSFMKSTKLKDQEREGIVLHNLDTDYKGDTTNYAKIMADYYSNLGAMIGLDGVYKPSGIVTDIEGSVMVGFSNTIFKSGSTYLPYASDGNMYSDSSDFMSFKAPFRYTASFKITVSKPFSLTLAMPIYSDPYFNYDFTDRAETMDWIDFLMKNPATTSSSDDITITEISSFTWSLSGSYTVKLPAFFNPFISTLGLSSFSASLVYTAKDNTSFNSDSSNISNGLSTYSPERKFYYPSQITPFKATGKLAGTLIDIPGSAATTTTAQKTAAAVQVSPPESLDDSEKAADNTDGKNDTQTGDSKTPAATASAPDSAAGGKPAQSSGTDSQTQMPLFGEDALPSISVSPSSATSIGGLTYKLSYSVTPDFTSQLSYASTDLSSPEDFQWSNLQSTYYQIKAPTTVASALNYRDSFLSLNDTFTFSPVYQVHPYLSDTYTDTSANSIKATDYAARKLDLTDVNALSFKPFTYTEHFSNTGLTWNTTVKMIRTKYISDNANEPEWEYLTTDLTDEDCVTAHTLDLALAADEGDFGQTLTLTTTLPPQVDAYSGILNLKFPNVTFSAGTGIKQTSSTDSTWIKEDFSQSLAVKLFSSKLTLSQSYVYDLEDSYADSLKFSLAYSGLQLAYTMAYTTGYDFVTEEEANNEGTTAGWHARDSQEFLPYTASLAYTSSSPTFKNWKNRISTAPVLSTSIVYDCLRPTNSYFTFNPGLTFKINEFLNLTFSSESKNSVIYRYFKGITGTDIDVAGETNPFTDLINSFRFDDDEKRKASGFKLKSIDVKITHELCDWDLNAEFKVSPRLVTPSSGSKYYDFSPYFTISVVWRPMEGMKTEIVDEYGDWELNP
jgi:lipopolysaccharide assembly outer membrane protein LptD (OstA)